MFCCMLPGFWFVTLFLPYWISGRTWHERVEVSREAITHTRIGWLAPKPAVYPLAKVEKLVIGWFRSGAGGDTTSQVRNYIVWRGAWGNRDYMLPQWLADPLQEQLFLTIREFATRNSIPLAFGEWGTRPEWAQKEGGQPPAP